MLSVAVHICSHSSYLFSFIDTFAQNQQLTFSNPPCRITWNIGWLKWRQEGRSNVICDDSALPAHTMLIMNECNISPTACISICMSQFSQHPHVRPTYSESVYLQHYYTHSVQNACITNSENNSRHRMTYNYDETSNYCGNTVAATTSARHSNGLP